MATILIVDDEYLIAQILEFALEDEGYGVVTASNGKKALDVIDRERPDLIITDFMMPTMDGLEFARAVRKRPELQKVPILLMSGAQGSVGRASPDLFAAVFDKPFKLEDITLMVNQLLGRPPGIDRS
ncbi:MAG: response regulator [Pseudomonas sp.]|uniref:response regulator n=1 Tax=Pseudomonas abieticivorans TaxID=2931382 RepID=UPI0020BEC36D|nr:response regulator [Pseudomonas sp. PIA16]MDE1168073.1 response regulator [Pseudomonas sp.]